MDSTRTIRRFVLAAVCGWLGLAACDEKTTLAEIDAPVDAEIRFVLEKTVGGSGNHFACSPRIIEAPRAYVIVGDRRAELPGTWAESDTVALVSDPTGARLAYRKKGEAWRPVWVGARRLLVGIDAQRLPGDAVDWAAAPTLEGAAPALFRDPLRRVAVLEELQARGPAPLSDLLVATRDMDDDHAQWNAGYLALPEEQRQVVIAALRGDLSAAAAVPGSLSRFSRLSPLAPEHRARALQLAAALDPAVGWQSEAIGRLALKSAALDPEATAPWACEQLGRSLGGGGDKQAVRPAAVAALSWAVASADAGCDPVGGLAAEVSRCDDVWRCGTPPRFPCDRAIIAERVRARVGELASAEQLPIEADEPAALSALRSLRVPDAVRRGQARRDYAADARGDACERAERPGQPCACDAEALRNAACAADAGEVASDNCIAVVDDKARRIGEVRAARAGWMVTLANGGSVTCGVAADRTAQCWGDLSRWPIEPGPRPSTPPDSDRVAAAERRSIAGLAKVDKVVTGSAHACALDQAGTSWCWSAIDPVARKLDGVTDIAAGLLHTCAVTAGHVSCWGAINMGQLPSFAPASTTVDTPTLVAGLEQARAVAAARFLTCALGAGGVTCWGTADQSGTFGPTKVPALEAAELLAVGSNGPCAVIPGGVVRCVTLGKDGQAAPPKELTAGEGKVSALASSRRHVAIVVGGEARIHALDGSSVITAATDVRAVAFDPDRDRLLAVTGSGEVRLLPVGRAP